MVNLLKRHMKYEMLLNILDKIREESASTNHVTRYIPQPIDLEKINAARSRAFIHLFLKVLFGLLDFNEREKQITDGSYDGGIDGYFIDKESKQIYLIQSKFRTNEKNFENKNIDLEEILAMDVDRILNGEEFDESGNPYNGKIKQLQREISNLPDVARYRYKLVLLANANKIAVSALRKIADGHSVEVFDFEKSYERLVFPVVTGTYFTASDISIPIDLSNKNAGSKISYTVRTKMCDCEITVLFVPTIEIAKLMSKYKNTVLRFNPRSYLDLDGKAVNSAIKETILNSKTNEFALYNNGITMLSDETYINEKIGQKNKAQLTVKNPQIINGGQTSFTLSRIYTENIGNDPEGIFQDKEILLKIITLIDNDSNEDKLQLIDEISNATNKQTPVITADKFANEALHQRIQKQVFDKFGLLYERKRGEFSDGVRDKYILERNVIERNLFLRLFYSANGNIYRGVQKKLFQKNDFSDINFESETSLNRFFLGYQAFRRLTKNDKKHRQLDNSIYVKIYVYNLLFLSEGLQFSDQRVDENILKLEVKWLEFLSEISKKRNFGLKFDKDGPSPKFQQRLIESQFMKSSQIENDLNQFFSNANVKGH